MLNAKYIVGNLSKIFFSFQKINHSVSRMQNTIKKVIVRYLETDILFANLTLFEVNDYVLNKKIRSQIK